MVLTSIDGAPTTYQTLGKMLRIKREIGVVSREKHRSPCGVMVEEEEYLGPPRRK